MKRTAIVLVLLIGLSLVATSCRSRKSCPGVGVEKIPTEQPAEKNA